MGSQILKSTGLKSWSNLDVDFKSNLFSKLSIRPK